jgi:hypothetical protein
MQKLREWIDDSTSGSTEPKVHVFAPIDANPILEDDEQWCTKPGPCDARVIFHAQTQMIGNMGEPWCSACGYNVQAQA